MARRIAVIFCRRAVKIVHEPFAAAETHAGWCRRGVFFTDLPFAHGGRRGISGPASFSEQLQQLVEANIEDEKFLRIPEMLALNWEYGVAHAPLILKRQCYDGMIRKILGNCTTKGTATVVTGTPGIGKTGFNMYFLWHLLRQQSDWQVIIVKFASTNWYYIFKKYEGRILTECVSGAEFVEKTAQTSSGPVWYLGDKRIDSVLWAMPCRFVLTCSPNHQNYYQFLKGIGRRIIYAPLWSKQELLQLNDRVFKRSGKEVQDGFDQWGGVPRFVFGFPREVVEKLMQEGVSKIRKYMLETSSVLVPDSADATDAKACHRILHYVVEKTDVEKDKSAFQDYVLRFASKYVEEDVLRSLPIKVLDKVLNKLTDPQTVKLQSALFDKLFHQLFSSGCKFQWKELDSEGKWGAVHMDYVEERFELLSLPTGGEKNQDAILPMSITPEKLLKTILKPESSDNPTWDLIKGKSIYQGTVSDEKRLVWTSQFDTAYNFLVSKLGMPPENREEWFEYVFVVPSMGFERFKLVLPEGNTKQNRMKAIQVFTDKRVKIRKMCCLIKELNEDVNLAVTAT